MYCYDIPVEVVLKILASLYSTIGIVFAVAYVIHCAKDEAKKYYLKQLSFWISIAVSSCFWPFFFSSTIRNLLKG